MLALFYLIVGCNLIELLTDQWKECEWYVPTGAAVIIFGAVEIIYWVTRLIIGCGC